MIKRYKFSLNDAIVYYYALLPVLAEILRDDGSYSFLKLSNYLMAILLSLNVILTKKVKLERYQIYFLIFSLFAFQFDFFRKDFAKGNKLLIESFLLMLFSASFVLNKDLKDKLINIFIFYIISTFFVILFQRTTGIFWERTAEIYSIDLAEVNNYRFAAYWVWIDWVAMLTTLPILLTFVLNDLINKRKYKFAYFLAAISVMSAILSGNRTLMLYIIVILLIFSKGHIFSSKNFRIVIVMIIIIAGFIVLDRYGISFVSIFSERIFQSDTPIEYRSEYSRIINYLFFFSHGISLWGEGYQISGQMAYLMKRASARMLIGILEPAFIYGVVISLFYYLSLGALLRKTYSIYLKYNNASFFLITLGFIFINLTTNVAYMINMQAFLFFLFLTNHDHLYPAENTTI